jgi:hypothetical protein
VFLFSAECRSFFQRGSAISSGGMPQLLSGRFRNFFGGMPPLFFLL